MGDGDQMRTPEDDIGVGSEAWGRRESQAWEGGGREGHSSRPPQEVTCDWPPQGYESDVIRVIKEEGMDGGAGRDGEKGAMVVEEKVVVEYERRRLTFRTLLEEDELAPLFDGAYWPGTMVWPVSLWTAEYLHRTYRRELKGARVVELGCGCGVPGMLCHLMGAASVALTEQAELMRIIRANIKVNFGVETVGEGLLEGAEEVGEAPASCLPQPYPSSSADTSPPPAASSSLFAAPLGWSREAARDFLGRAGWGRVDLAVCCDCIYAPFWGESYKDLLACFEEFAATGPATFLGIISVERRNADGVDDFLACAGASMQVTQVLRDEARGWFIYELRKKVPA